MLDRIWYIAKTYIISSVLIAALLLAVFFSIYFNRDEAKKQTELGEKAYSAQKYEEAVKHYTNAIAHSAHLIKAYVGLARSYIALDEYDKAEAILLDSIETDPNTSSPYIILAELYQARNETEKFADLILQMEKAGLNSWASSYARYEWEDSVEFEVGDYELTDPLAEPTTPIPVTETEKETAQRTVSKVEESTTESPTESSVKETSTEPSTTAPPPATQPRTQPPTTTEHPITRAIPTTMPPRAQPPTTTEAPTTTAIPTAPPATTEAPTEPPVTEPFIENSETMETSEYSDEFIREIHRE